MSIFEIDSLCRINSTLNRLAAGTVSLDKYNQLVDAANRAGAALREAWSEIEDLRFDLNSAKNRRDLLQRACDQVNKLLAAEQAKLEKAIKERDDFESRLRFTAHVGVGFKRRAEAAEAELARLKAKK